jgi:hypothetical protein
MSDESTAATIHLAKSFANRANEAVMLAFKSVRIGDWVPAIQHCHDNVARWVERHPTSKQIFGCIRQENPPRNSVRLTPHSAVQDENGDLFDITPNAWGSWVWFIPHIGTEEEFTPLALLPEIEMPYSNVGHSKDEVIDR